MPSKTQTDILILTAVFGFASTLLMVLRVIIRKIKKQPLDISDYLTLVAIACVQARVAFTVVVVLWGNNNDHHVASSYTPLNPVEIHRLVVGSKLTLANRFIYNTYLWIQKAVVLLLYKRIFSPLPAAARVITIYWLVFCVTYLGIQAACLLDCVPVRLYWQVVPSPGPCTCARIQLLTFVSLNIFTDVMLLIFPIPWVLSLQHTSLKRRLQLISLFSIGVLLIAIAIVRLPVYGNGTSQVRRNLWGSIEQFGSALVANLPVIYSLLRKKPPGRTLTACTEEDSLDRRRLPRSTPSYWASEVELAPCPPADTAFESKDTSTIGINYAQGVAMSGDRPQ